MARIYRTGSLRAAIHKTERIATMKPLSRRDALLSTLAASALAASPGSSRGAAGWDPVGWREAVLIVPALAPWIEVLTTVGGWEVALRSPPDDSLNRLWSLPKGAVTEQVLMRNPEAESGMIRLVVVTGAPQNRIRPHDQPWETGGISSLYLRATDMDATRQALEARGWNAASIPVQYTIEGGEVARWGPRSPDGIRLEFFHSLRALAADAPPQKPWGHVVSLAIPVKDMDKSYAFLGGVLRLKQGGHVETIGGDDGANKMGLPYAFKRAAKVDIYGFTAGPTHGSAFDVILMPQAQGRDFSGDARPPNLGIAALRFVVSDVAAVAAACKAGGFALAAPVQDITLAPYGRAKTFAVTGPEGVWLEFIQPAA
jgi:catechol 2,3-dioxygenase-like lactoylglutathione lyase family enzyme